MMTTDIMIHINESLAETKQHALETELRTVEGVIAPRFNKPHLLVVAYDMETTSSQVILQRVINKGYQAQLVGL